MLNIAIFEKRRYVRLYRRIGVNIVGYNAKKTEPKLDEEVGHDISVGGMLIECSKRLSRGSSLKLKIMLTFDSQYRIVEAPATVVWNKKSFRNTYYLGCKFLRLKPKDKAALIRYIKKNLP